MRTPEPPPRDFRAGQVFRLERTITEEMIRKAVELTGDRGRWHVDPDFARASGFQGCFAPGLLTASLPAEFGGQIDYLATRMVFEFAAPVYAGERLVAEIRVKSFEPATRRLTASFSVKSSTGQVVLRGQTAGFASGPARKDPTPDRSGTDAYRKACAHDRAGEEAEAIPLYREALRLGLGTRDRAGALLGLGSSLRNVGRHDESVRVLQGAVDEFPDQPALRAFLALSLESAGRPKEALHAALGVVLELTELDGYAPALEGYRHELLLDSAG